MKLNLLTISLSRRVPRELIHCVLFFGGWTCAEASLVIYPNTPGYQTDGKVSGTLNGQPVIFEYQHTYHPDYIGNRDMLSSRVRFAADGPVDVQLTVDASISTAHLRTVGKDLPFTRNGSHFEFTLPGPGNYYLQLPDLNVPGKRTYTVFFFFDDLSFYQAYQQLFASARNVLDHGVVSHPTLDQTDAVQSTLNGRGSIYFPPGTYRTGQINLSSNTTVYLAPGALLKGTDDYNTDRYIWIGGGSSIRIAGLGVIDVNGHTSGNIPTKGHGIDMEGAADVDLNDVLFRDSNSWMLHIRKCDRVTFDNIKLFSGKDGIDPDGSRDVLITRATIQSVDDGLAVKSRFTGRSCERVTMRDCIVFSAASALKIGTENYHIGVRDILWDHCDAVDADRGCVLYTRPETGTAPISNVTWRNIRIFNFAWDNQGQGSPFHLRNDGGASISNVRLENITAYPRTNCSVRGSITATFQNVIMNGASAIPTDGLTFAGVIWPGVTSQSRPVVFIEPSPRNQNIYVDGDEVTVDVRHPFGRAITQVQLFVDGQPAGTQMTGPYRFTLSGLADGEHKLTAMATDADGAGNTTAPRIILSQVAPGTRGDFDNDGDVDLDDFGFFQTCYTGSGVVQDDPDCAGALLDNDADVDLDDFAIFRECMSGANIPAEPQCAD